MASRNDAADHDVHPPAAVPSRAEERSTGQLFSDIVGELQTIVRKEVELARHEVREALVARGQAMVALAIAGVLGLVALGCGVTAAAIALSVAMPRWAAWAVVALILLLLAGAALAIARSRLRAVPLQPERTRRSIEENARWATTQLRR